MNYQKMIDLSDHTPNQPSKFRTKSWVEINNDSRGRYSTNSQTKCKTQMLKSSLWDYRDAYILLKGVIIAVAGRDTAAETQADENNKQAIRVFYS